MSKSKVNGSKQEVTHFYLPPHRLVEGRCRFSREESHHIVSVCRYARGDVISGTDGIGHLYSVEILEIDDNRVMGHVIDERTNVNELPIEIAVAFGMMPMRKTEEVVDQLTQLGVRRIIPLLSEKSLVRLDKHRLAVKADRWQRVAIAAMKQSLRCVLPEISTPLKLSELMAQFEKYDLALVASLRADASLSEEKLQEKKGILLLTGPEEGFSTAEENSLTSAGAAPVSLGARRFRAELAPIVFTSIVLAHT